MWSVIYYNLYLNIHRLVNIFSRFSSVRYTYKSKRIIERATNNSKLIDQYHGERREAKTLLPQNWKVKANLSELNLFIVKFDPRRYFVQRFDRARIERFFELSIFRELDLKLNSRRSIVAYRKTRKEGGRRRRGTEIFGSNSKSCMPMTRCIGYSSDKTLRGKVGRNSSWQIVKTSSPRHKGNHYYP